MHPQPQSIADAVAQILAEADADIAARKPVCQASGRCCKFEEYGHSLFVTAAEMIHFSHVHSQIENRKSKIENSPPISLPQFFAQPTPTGCPYQIDGLCTAREARPLGCRLYFCDANAQSWQSEVYEKYHRKLVQVHQQFDLPYRYLEWRVALKELIAPGELHAPQS
jgi:Fe-S-cluster containining protein